LRLVAVDREICSEKLGLFSVPRDWEESTGSGEARVEILRVKNLAKEFDGLKAVDGLSFDLTSRKALSPR